MRLSFWYDAREINLRPMPLDVDELNIFNWYEKEIEVGITHRLNAPSGEEWKFFFTDDEVIHKRNKFYQLSEERFVLFVLTYY